MERKSLIDLPLGNNPPKVINAIVEIPQGSRNKYEYDKELNIFRLDRLLYSSVH
jgi:inorganic pyrophosphatase